MKNFLSLLLFIFVFIFITILRGQEIKKVLILHSYDEAGNYWVSNLNRGIYDAFSKSKIPILSSSFYFNETGQDEKERLIFFETLVLEKGYYNDYDLIMISDNYALEKILSKRKEFFGNKPIVFLGINDFDPQKLADTINITGVPEKLPIKETFELIFKFHPDKKNLYIALDSTITGKKILSEIQRLHIEFSNVNFIYIIENSYSQLSYKLNFIEPTTPIFFAAKLFSDEKEFLPYEYAYAELLKNVQNPSYSCWDVLLGRGIIGGYFFSGYEHGYLAAEIAIRVLIGYNIGNLSLTIEQKPKLKIDYLEAIRKKINIDNIKEEVEFINKKEVLLSNKLVLTTAVLFLVIIILISFSIYFYFKTKLIQRQEKEEKLYRDIRSSLDNLTCPIFLVDKKNNIAFINKYVETLSGYSKEELLSSPKNLFEIIKPCSEEIYDKFAGLKQLNEIFYLKAKDNSVYLFNFIRTTFPDKKSEVYLYFGESLGEILNFKENLDATNKKLLKLTEFLDETGFVFIEKKDEQFIIVSANVGTIKITGFLEQDIIGASISIFGEEFQKIIQDYFDSSLSGYSANKFFSNIISKDKQLKPVEIKIVKIECDEKSKIEALIFIRDVAEELKKEKEINEKNFFYEKQKILISKIFQLDIFKENERELATEILCKELTDIFSVQRASLWFLDESKTKVVCYKLYDATKNSFASGQEIRKFSYPMFFHFLHIENLIAAEFAQEDSRTSELKNDYFKANDIVSVLATAIKSKDELVGLISLEKTAHRKWTKEEKEFINQVVNLGLVIFEAVKQNLIEKSLKESEEKYKTYVEIVSDGIFAIENETIKFVNEQFIVQFGYTLTEVIHSSIYNYFDENDIKAYLNFNFKDEKSGKKNVKFKSTFKTKREILTPVEIQAVILYSSNIPAILFYVKDLSESLHLQQEVKKNLEKINAIVKSLPDLIFVLDMDGNVLDYHVPPDAALAVERDKVTQTNISQIFDSETANLVLHKIRYANLTGEVQSLEYSLNINGETKYYEARFEALEKNLTLAICREITAQKLSLEKINLLNSAIEQSPITVFITNSNGVIEYANAKTFETSGYTKEEVLGKTPKIFSSGLMPKEFYKKMWDDLLNGKEWKGEILNKRKNGEMIWELLLISPVKNSKNQITHFIAFKEDITERKRLLNELIEAKNKAVESDRLKSNLLANLSHEFRTPLNGIIGSIEIILDEYGENEIVKSIYNNIVFSSKRLLFTLDSILKFSQLENDIVKLYIKSCYSKTIFSEALKEYELLARQKNIRIIFEDVDDFKFQADAELLEFAFKHLLDNAIKFNKTNGTVEIKLKLIENYIHIEVKDTGIGIDENYKDKIFQAFSQASEGLDRKYEGSGLGLAIVKKIANLMNGEIIIESQKEIGTSAILKIPFMPAFVKFKEQTEKELIFIDEFKKQILLVEDNQINSFLVVKMLEDKYSLTVAKNGEEAIKLAEKTKFDIVLCDINLVGGIDGVETMKRIRQIPGYEHIPFGAITGYTNPFDRERFLKEGFDDFLGKPFEKKDLLKLIENLTKTGMRF